MQRIIRRAALKEYREVLVACSQSEMEVVGDEWNLGKLAGISAEAFQTWAKMNTTGYDEHIFLALDKCVDFKKDLWFELGKCIWRKHRSVYQDYMKYICNDIVKPFKVKILLYYKRVREMHDLAK